MQDNNLSTDAWLLSGLTGRIPGILQLLNGRITFIAAEKSFFDVPLDEVQEINFPWHYFGGGMKFRIGAESYRFSFTEPGEQGSIVDARERGKLWKALLTR